MRAVSPVTGTILMVAITVVLAGVVFTFVSGLSPSEPTPRAQFNVSLTEYSGQPDEVRLTHIAGDEIDNDKLYVRLSGTEVQEESGSPGPAERLSFDTLGDNGDAVKPTDSVQIEPRDSTPDMEGRTIYIIYDNGDEERLVASYTPDESP